MTSTNEWQAIWCKIVLDVCVHIYKIGWDWVKWLHEIPTPSLSLVWSKDPRNCEIVKTRSKISIRSRCRKLYIWLDA